MSYLQYRRLFLLEIPISVFFSFHHDSDNHLCANRHKKSPILGSQFFQARGGPFNPAWWSTEIGLKGPLCWFFQYPDNSNLSAVIQIVSLPASPEQRLEFFHNLLYL